MHHRSIKNLARRCSAAVLAGLMLLSVLPGASAQEPTSGMAPSAPAVSTPAPESTQAPMATHRSAGGHGNSCTHRDPRAYRAAGTGQPDQGERAAGGCGLEI